MLRTAQRMLEGLWSAAFDVLGRLRPSSARPLRFGGGATVLVVAPHPDDEVAGCGGTIACHRAAGDRVVIAYVTDGRRSRALGLPPAETAEVRRREAEAAALELGVDGVVWLGLREGDGGVAAPRQHLEELLERVAPAVIYAPSRVDFHPEHKAVAHALALALAGLRDAGGPSVRVFQVQVPLATPLVNRFCDIAAVTSAHDRALAAHASQAGSLAPCRRMKRYAAGRHGTAGPTEEFWEMAPAQYAALHRSPPGEWSERFRALRYPALADPAAYLVGRAARRRLLNRDAR